MTLIDILFGFSGRIRRGGWWLGVAVMIGLNILWSAVFGSQMMAYFEAQQMLLETGDVSALENVPVMTVPATVTSLLLSALGIWIYAATSAKRFMDRGGSPWMALIILIPLIGGLWVLIACGFLRGDDGPNRYGPAPS